MFYTMIERKCNLWYREKNCPAKDLVNKIIKKGMMRKSQIKAIRTYLFLKLAGNNRSLSDLFKEGFFCTLDINNEPLPTGVRNQLESDGAARTMYEFSKLYSASAKIKKTAARELSDAITKRIAGYDFGSVIDNMFYGVSYSDCIYSLPMGAGKTFLMAAFIYIDLYYSEIKDDPRFARNFLICAPSGLKSSILPSLRTIESFDPAWIFDENTAARLKAQIRFEVLDEQAGVARSNRVRNPNAHKIALHQPFDDLRGLVAVTNAEKVILQGYEAEDGTEETGNELRDLIGRIPRLSVLIDEVHHVPSVKKETDETKLRRVVEGWAKSSHLVSVLGFSGTPYTEKPEKFPMGDGTFITGSFLTNVVCHYPLRDAISTFLKKPEVFVPDRKEITRDFIVREGVRDFLTRYGDKVYPDGTCAKLAVYCAFVEELENEIWPKVCDTVREFGLNPAETVLKYHGGGKGKTFALPKENREAFARLDNPLSRVKIVLLAQIGKEGWDCRSLTGVVLSAPNVCARNMVLQTCCRCLRQVPYAPDAHAVIWLNSENCALLEDQLSKQQDMSLQEFKSFAKQYSAMQPLAIYDRQPVIGIGKIRWFDMVVEYPVTETQEPNDPHKRLISLRIADFVLREVRVRKTTLNNLESTQASRNAQEREERPQPVTFISWKHMICHEAGFTITFDEIDPYDDALLGIFSEITEPLDEANGIFLLRDDIDQVKVRHAVRMCFNPVRIAHQNVRYEQLERPLAEVRPFYGDEAGGNLQDWPDDTAVERILDADNGNLTSVEDLASQVMKAMLAGDNDLVEELNEKARSQREADELLGDKVRLHSMHYLPYRFADSMEVSFYRNNLTEICGSLGLDFYYNGDTSMGQLIITSYSHRNNEWKRNGRYHPDFLVIERDRQNSPVKVLIIETKGEVFAHKFTENREFMKEFIAFNRSNGNPVSFDFLYIEDSMELQERCSVTIEKIREFFNVKQ